MICLKCKKPYLFISEGNPDYSECRRCGNRQSFALPDYSGYHSALYDKPYRRDAKTDPQMREILRRLQLQPPERVLDIGCGPGDYTAEIARVSKNTTGIDLDVGLAQRKHGGLDFIGYDCNKGPLPFGDSSVDVIVSINLIEHLRYPEKFLEECRRVLRENGRIAITSANLDFFLHDYFFDKTHLHEWRLGEFSRIVGRYFKVGVAKKSSSMFNYYPYNFFLVNFLKPDLLIVGKK